MAHPVRWLKSRLAAGVILAAWRPRLREPAPLGGELARSRFDAKAERADAVALAVQPAVCGIVVPAGAVSDERADLGAAGGLEAHAGPAMPATSRRYVGVLVVEWMPLRAMRLGRVLGRDTIATEQIRALRDDFEMGRVGARAHLAKMIYDHSLGDGADEKQPRDPVRCAPATADRHRSIAVPVRAGTPNPTAVVALLDAFVESLKNSLALYPGEATSPQVIAS